MGKTSFIMALLAMLFSGSISASDPVPGIKSRDLSLQIQEILDENSIYVRNKDLTAKVLFTVTDDKRIIVLEIKSDYMDVKGFLKRSLNKKRVKVSDLAVGEQYIVDVRITS